MTIRPVVLAVLGGLLLVVGVAVALGSLSGSLRPQLSGVASRAVSTQKKFLEAEEGCSAVGENCFESKCCAAANLTCYVKDLSWAGCRNNCTSGQADPFAPKAQQTPWSCDDPSTMLMPTGGSANSGCYVVKDAKVLVVKHSYGTLDIPGGLADWGESSDATAVRETFEESGFKVKAIGLKKITANGFHIFSCTLLEEWPSGHPDPGEVSQVMWLPVNQLPDQGWRFPDELEFFRTTAK